MKSEKSLSAFIESKQKDSYYWFNSQEYLSQARVSSSAFRNAVSRLVKQQRTLRIVKDFYVIIPPEYRKKGIIPTTWFIDDLSRHFDINYYVSLLTAASILGFAHQQPQQFQVMVNQQQKLNPKQTYATYVVKHDIHPELFQKEKCETGYFNIARKEALVFDLVQYMHLCGYLNNVGTILYEIGDELDPQLLAKTALTYPKTVIQRLGYLLDFVEHADKTTELNKILNHQKINYIKLSPSSDKTNVKNKKWHIIINEEVDIDL